MIPDDYTDVKLQDPLSEITRKERRALLGFSIVGIGIEKAGLIPNKIPALGIEFANTDQSALLFVYSLVVAYFLLAFIIYAASDFLTWRLSYIKMIKGIVLRRRDDATIISNQKIDEERIITDAMESRRLELNLRDPVSLARALFEFIVPIIVGLYAIYVLQTLT